MRVRWLATSKGQIKGSTPLTLTLSRRERGLSSTMGRPWAAGGPRFAGLGYDVRVEAIVPLGRSLMRIGLFPGSVPGQLKSLAEVIDQVVKAENDGFDGYWTPHLSGRGFDALTVLALVGGRTSRIELGTAVVPTYPRHPTAIAQQAMTVQVASSGRLALGIGPSHRPAVEDSWGLSYDRAALHTREYVSVLSQLVADGAASYSGEMYRVEARAEMTGVSPFPVLISALAPAMLRVAGEITDGTITWMCGINTIGNHVVPRINQAAERAGRPAPRVCVGAAGCGDQ